MTMGMAKYPSVPAHRAAPLIGSGITARAILRADARNLDAPRMMVIDTDLQPQFLTRDPTAEDWRNGVIFKYLPGDGSLGLGRYPAVLRVRRGRLAVRAQPVQRQPGSEVPQRGAHGPPGVQSGQQVYDPRTRSFVSLPAGPAKNVLLHEQRHSSLQPCQRIGSMGANRSWGTVVYNDGGGWQFAAGVDPCKCTISAGSSSRAYSTENGPSLAPRQVFHPPFEIRVDPQITVDQIHCEGILASG